MKSTALGLRYNLLTDYTSFVAVARKRSSARAAWRRTWTNLARCRLEFRNSAVGPDGDGADEPELWILAALVGLVLALRALQARARSFCGEGLAPYAVPSVHAFAVGRSDWARC